MVATVGSISIDLSTNAAKFATGFKSAASTVDRESSRMSKAVAGFGAASRAASGVLSGFVGGIVAGGALAALTSLGGALGKAREALSEFEAIANEARVTGLKTDMFQAISFGALEADVSQEKLNAGLEIFAKNFGLAQVGTGALYSKLKELNPELLRAVLSTNDQGERLKLVADAMRDTTDATQKAALATAVFGKGGIELVRVLDGGRKAIDDFKRRAADLGLIIPDDLLQRAGELDDKLEVLAKVTDVNLKTALVNLAPWIVGATEGMANFSKEINATAAAIDEFVKNPSLENFSKILGLELIDGGFADKARDAFNSIGEASHRTTEEIKADIVEVQQKLDDLKVQAEAGFFVDLETDRALEDLKVLQEELRRTGIAAAAAAANGSGALSNLVKNSLDAIGGTPAATPAASKPLPTVTRYGGDPSAPITNGGFNTRQDVNGSGVNVIKPVLDETAGYTEDTADNVERLDRNTKSYLDSLSSDIGQYSAQTNYTINQLSDVTAETGKYLSQAVLAALVMNNPSGVSGGMSIPGANLTLDSEGNVVDPRSSDYEPISSYREKRATYGNPQTGGSDTSVSVSQPGTNVTLNYQAAPGESERTARQRAREMYDELLLQSARA